MIEDVVVEPRAAEILDQVKAIFAVKGFEGASMQNLAQAAGMSAGNFYRYFPSKNALIEAMVERELDCVRASFAGVLIAVDPLCAFREMVRARIETPSATEAAIWAEIEAAAARRPEFARLLDRLEGEITRGLIAVFARICGLSEVEAAARFTAHARLMMILVQGVCMQCTARPGGAADPHDKDMAALVVRLLEHTLSEIMSVAPEADGLHCS